jgi:hypothetical protein
MLVSHRKHFIYTKTAKTAGTSVESYFEKYCMPEGEWKETHLSEEYVSDTGIIGYRGSRGKGLTYYNHMSADSIRNLVGQDIWNSYFKFTVIRNPYDKLISWFAMCEQQKQNYDLRTRAKCSLKRLLRRGNPSDRVKGRTDVERFRSWIHLGGTIDDRDKYLVGGKVCVDYFIRFENLQEDVHHVCDRLSIPYIPENIPSFKKGMRSSRLKVRDYFDEGTKRIVEKNYAWEIEHFGYSFPE